MTTHVAQIADVSREACPRAVLAVCRIVVHDRVLDGQVRGVQWRTGTRSEDMHALRALAARQARHAALDCGVAVAQLREGDLAVDAAAGSSLQGNYNSER